MTYYLTECLLIKNENQYLIEHIQRNHAAGIEHFYIYDNNSDESVADFLANNAPDLMDLCTIEILSETIDGDLPLTEVAYKKYLDSYKKDTVWCAFIDTDEMFTGNLLNLCKEAEQSDYKGLSFYPISHGAKGQVRYEDKPLFERFGQFSEFSWGEEKAVSQVAYIQHQYTHSTVMCEPEKQKIARIDRNEVSLHHFFTKSLEEFCQKLQRGHVWSQWKTYPIDIFRQNAFKDISDEDYNAVLKEYGFISEE